MNLAGLGLVTVVFVDLATKVAASELASNETTGAVVPVRNHEFSLGIAGAGLTTTIGLAAIGIVIAAALMWAPTRRGELAPWIPATVVGGALANLVDRILFGSVHDFLATPWIVFNVADVAVAAGLIGLIVTRLRHHHASSKAREVIPCEPTLPA
jgi:lipoprotein signal peptidase